jgi:hypothetical protein
VSSTSIGSACSIVGYKFTIFILRGIHLFRTLRTGADAEC